MVGSNKTRSVDLVESRANKRRYAVAVDVMRILMNHSKRAAKQLYRRSASLQSPSEKAMISLRRREGRTGVLRTRDRVTVWTYEGVVRMVDLMREDVSLSALQFVSHRLLPSLVW